MFLPNYIFLPIYLHMVWLNIEKLEAKLKTDAVSNKEATNYLIANTLLFTLSSYASIDNDSLGWWQFLEQVLVLAIVIWGILKTFYTNQQGDDREYFKRFQALFFVVGIRVLLLMSGIVVMSVLLFGKSGVTENHLYKLSLIVGGNLIFYWNLNGSFKRVSQGDIPSI